MATPNNMPLNPDTTLITVKVAIDSTNRRFKLTLRDLGANVFPDVLRNLLEIPADRQVLFERYSDSAATYVTLDSNNPAIYKQLYRAAKAKLKLRIRATVAPASNDVVEEAKSIEVPPVIDMPAAVRPRSNYLETVLDPAPETTTFTQALQMSMKDLYLKDLSAAIPKLEDDKETSLSAPSCVPNMMSSSPNVNTAPCFRVFAIDCNNCNSTIPNEHYHCSICEDGDFDLCMACVEKNISCPGEGHWLIKRTLKEGRVVTSTTESIKPKKAPVPESKPVAPVPEVREYVVERTCNSCIGEFPNSEFVSCADCYDFDLCYNCLIAGQHGHNPSHRFVQLEEHKYNKLLAEDPEFSALCEPGRNVSHLAICDGCDKNVQGVRNKCLTCPDFDYCSDCIGKSAQTHPSHRFAPLYEPIADPMNILEVHYGIYCDGPLCKDTGSYIRGIRYKCAVCHDTDFCANCEAHPLHEHDATHPLIKFRTPVKYVSVTTFGEDQNGVKMAQMGDRMITSPHFTRSPVSRQNRATATETYPIVNAATQVQTMADIKPDPVVAPVEQESAVLDAYFVRDTVNDGTVLPPDHVFTQTWTLKNPGPAAWPSGSSVRFIGGDSMLKLDAHHPSSVSDIANATESNVLTAPVKAGESAEFSVTMKTPVRSGRVISYWRLKTPHGLPYGHKLWCDVSVRQPTAELSSAGHVAYASPSVKDEEEEASVKPEGSTMIFPKLDKESPVSSVHEDAPPTAPAVEGTDKEFMDDLLEEVDNLELDDDETDDGFLTDEEYDILDASDEEFLSEAQRAVQRK